MADSVQIVLVTHYYATHRGGIEIVAKALGEALVSHHPARIVWCASDTVLPGEDGPAGLAHDPMHAWNIVEDRVHVPYPLWGLGSLGRLWKHIGACDVVHLHDFFYMGNACAYGFARLRGKPVLVTQHIGEVPYRNPVLRLLLGTANATLGRFMLSRADRVVFISETVKGYFEGRFRFRNEPLFMPNGVDTGIFQPAGDAARRAARAALGLSGERPVFLFVGRFVEKKGLHILRELAGSFPEVDWVFAGWGPLDPEGWGLPQVHLVRGKSGAELASVYQAADLLVLPSVGEGFPLVIQEAMACGTPAFVGSVTARAQAEATPLMIHEAVDESGGAGPTVARWSERIRAVLAESAELARRREEVAAFAHAKWSWRGCAAFYEALFREVVSRG